MEAAAATARAASGAATATARRAETRREAGRAGGAALTRSCTLTRRQRVSATHCKKTPVREEEKGAPCAKP